jgi:hypothetical protein
MGYRSKSLTIASDYTAQGFSDRLSPGSLVAATLQARSSGQTPVSGYARIFVAESRPDAIHTVFHLKSDYLGWVNPLTWQGTLPVGSEHFIVAIIHGTAGTTYRLTWWTTDKFISASGYPRDP